MGPNSSYDLTITIFDMLNCKRCFPIFLISLNQSPYFLIHYWSSPTFQNSLSQSVEEKLNIGC